MFLCEMNTLTRYSMSDVLLVITVPLIDQKNISSCSHFIKLNVFKRVYKISAIHFFSVHDFIVSMTVSGALIGYACGVGAGATGCKWYS